MTARLLFVTAFSASVVALAVPDATAGAAPRKGSPRPHAARNIILLIGDGLGDSQITIARNYQVGPRGRLAMDTLPFTGSMIVSAIQEDDPGLPDYVADSAAGATAWATGVRTSNTRLSTTAHADGSVPTILELAQAHGLRVGNVTTAELVDATPAALAAHVNHRRCYGPEDMDRCPQYRKTAGGPGSIAEQLVDHRIDVLLGGGRSRFEQRIDGGPDTGTTVVASARRQGYAVIETAAELETVRPGQPILGLFAPGNLSVEWTGEPAAPHPGSGPQRCRPVSRPPGEPTLATLTHRALELLDTRGPRGFFLQIEGASIDKRGHAADPCGEIGETVAFDAAVRVALDYAAGRSDTLVIVTADHGHASQILPAPDERDHCPGVYSTLVTIDGAPMTVGYGTNTPGRSQEHTGTQVRIAAQGPGAEAVAGVIEQAALFRIMADALGLQRPRQRER